MNKIQAADIPENRIQKRASFSSFAVAVKKQRKTGSGWFKYAKKEYFS
jgi:hypothetical protein